MTQGFNPAFDGPNASQCRFLRVQNSEGNGPYSGDNIVLPGKSTPKHPAPSVDGLDIPWSVKKLYRFGFRSWSQLHDWMMPQNLPLLHEAYPGKWNVIEYAVPAWAVRHGKHQSIVLAAALDGVWMVQKYSILDVITAFPAVPEGEVTFSW